jgi:adenosylmethionine-8-amino-7-oxononanoate aminotransferase
MTPEARFPLWELLGPPSSFGQPERTAVRARGTEILFADGHWRLCGTSGLWNANLGYGNRPIASAIADALVDASYLTLFRAAHMPAVRASRALLDLCGPNHFGRVLFSTSGSAANDMVMKLARQYWALHRQFRRRVIVGFRNSYHGLTYGSHALTGSSLGQSYYSVDQTLVRHVSHEDPAELEQLLQEEGHQVAAVVVEPVLGTGALRVEQPMLDALARWRAAYGFLLVADEVATGFGRTGTYFASERWPVRPDVLIASKGITNGTCAVAVALVSHEICERFERSDAALTHAETQAGTPATCAAILATMEQMAELDAIRRGQRVARRLTEIITGLSDHPLVSGEDGTGCFRAIRLAHGGKPLDAPAVTAVVEAVRARDVLIQAGPGCIQLVPALVYDEAALLRLAGAVRAGLDAIAEVLPEPNGELTSAPPRTGRS